MWGSGVSGYCAPWSNKSDIECFRYWWSFPRVEITFPPTPPSHRIAFRAIPFLLLLHTWINSITEWRGIHTSTSPQTIFSSSLHALLILCNLLSTSRNDKNLIKLTKPRPRHAVRVFCLICGVVDVRIINWFTTENFTPINTINEFILNIQTGLLRRSWHHDYVVPYNAGKIDLFTISISIKMDVVVYYFID